MTHQGGPAGAEREALASKIIRKMKDKKLTFKAVADKAAFALHCDCGAAWADVAAARRREEGG